MKVLIFIPNNSFSLSEMIKEGFDANGIEYKIVDFKDILPGTIKYINILSNRFRLHVVRSWKMYFMKVINKKYYEIIKKEKPDFLMIYNHQFILPELLENIKNNVKIAFFLGDNPLYSINDSDYNLSVLMYSNYTICPDSHWRDTLNAVGAPNVKWDHIGY